MKLECSTSCMCREPATGDVHQALATVLPGTDGATVLSRETSIRMQRQIESNGSSFFRTKMQGTWKEEGFFSERKRMQTRSRHD